MNEEKKIQVLAGVGGQLHRRFNYELCNAVDLLKLGIVLEKMVKAGKLDPCVADIYKKQGEALCAALRAENDRAFGFKPRGLLIGRSNEFEFKYEQAGSRGPYEEPECEHEFFRCMVPAGDSCVPIYHQVCKHCRWDRTKGMVMPKDIWEKWAIPQLGRATGTPEPECEHEFFDYMIDMKRSSLHPSILNLVHNEVCKLCHWNQSNGSIVSKEDWEKFAIPQLKALKEE